MSASACTQPATTATKPTGLTHNNACPQKRITPFKVGSFDSIVKLRAPHARAT